MAIGLGGGRKDPQRPRRLVSGTEGDLFGPWRVIRWQSGESPYETHSPIACRSSRFLTGSRDGPERDHDNPKQLH
jgi:hypothetical protein